MLRMTALFTSAAWLSARPTSSSRIEARGSGDRYGGLLHGVFGLGVDPDAFASGLASRIRAFGYEATSSEEQVSIWIATAGEEAQIYEIADGMLNAENHLLLSNGNGARIAAHVLRRPSFDGRDEDEIVIRAVKAGSTSDSSQSEMLSSSTHGRGATAKRIGPA